MCHLSKLFLKISTGVFVGCLGISFAIAQLLSDARSGSETQTAAPDQYELSATSGAQAPYTVAYEGHWTIRPDLTATEVTIRRFTINTQGAIATVGQQVLPYIEGMQVLDIVEAFTEKADGRRIPVAAANILTSDAPAPPLAIYFRDMKQRTVIFSDLAVGDTLVLTSKTEHLASMFPGQFVDGEIFPRSTFFTSAKATIEAPAALDLQVRVTDGSGSDAVETSGGIRRHRITIIPTPYHPEEPGAVSSSDRDPLLMISTLKSYEELGRAYGAAAFPKAAVTPEIAALANEITHNITDPRAQAAAIDAWMKKNIRYVAIYLSLGRIVPNGASDILRNRFGDCKDKVTLMLALLAAKGIPSEEVLINLGNAYVLPGLPTQLPLNHVILYLPEFDLYDDPTVSWAAFGVLAPEAYDKPVVRVSPAAATLARTPAMRQQDHTAHTETTILVAADGTISGRTRESDTGVFGIMLRAAGGLVQTLGDETAAQRILQANNTPGTGRIDLGDIARTIDPATTTSSFTLNGRFRPPGPGVRLGIPFGLPLSPRVGNNLLGTRLAGRQVAFACYAGTQTEDIDVTYDTGLPMPIALLPVSIDNSAFSYRSTYRIEERTLKIHREFTSHVPGQVCAPEVEEKLAGDFNAVRIDANASYAFASSGPPVGDAGGPPQTIELKRAMNTGQKLRLDFLYSLNVDCSSMGFANVRIVEPPQHGKAVVEHGTGLTTFPESNPRSACNKRPSEGTLVNYEPSPDYTGTDSVTIMGNFVSGAATRRHYAITVGPAIVAEANPLGPRPAAPTSIAPRVIEFTRVAAADQKLLVAFVFDLNPDCSSIGYASIRITEQPQHGKVTVENGTGFSTFVQNNVRYECNKLRTDGVVVSYLPDPGFTGPDSLSMDVILPDGGFNKRHYAIDVR